MAVVAAVIQHRRVDRFQHTITRVQLEAQSTGEGMDLAAILAASDADRVGLAPHIDGARVASVTTTPESPTAVIDYEISQSGEHACVRVTRSAGDTEVTEAEVACQDFTFSPTL